MIDAWAEHLSSGLPLHGNLNVIAFHSSFSSEEKTSGSEEEVDTSLTDTAQDEREYVRCRLRDELGSEPSEEEVDEWLRRHTEGY